MNPPVDPIDAQQARWRRIGKLQRRLAEERRLAELHRRNAEVLQQVVAELQTADREAVEHG